MTVEQGTLIPDFRLPASTGQTLERDAFVGTVPMVIFFLPGIESKVDRGQILEFNQRLVDFGKQRCQVLGVAPNTATELRDLSQELDLALPLLADPAGQMRRDFDVSAGEQGTRRVTVIVDVEGRVVRIFDPAPPSGQADAMLSAVRELRAGDLDPVREPVEEPPG